MEQKKKSQSVIFLLLLVLVCHLSACLRDSAKYWHDRGVSLNDNGKFLDAIGAFNRAIQLDSAYGPAYFDRGNSHQQLGNYHQALDDYNKALSLNDNSVPEYEIYRSIGVAHFRMGKIQDAIAEWKKGLAKVNDAATLNNLAVAYLRLNQVDKAAETASSAYKANPSLPQVLNTVGQIAMVRRDFRQAIDFFERAIDRDPNSPTRYWNAALACQKDKQYDKALQYAGRYVEKEKEPDQLRRGYKLIEQLRDSAGK